MTLAGAVGQFLGGRSPRVGGAVVYSWGVEQGTWHVWDGAVTVYDCCYLFLGHIWSSLAPGCSCSST